MNKCVHMFWIKSKNICDPLCENPAKIIFLWFAVFYQKQPAYDNEHSVKIVPFISLMLTE